MVKKLVFRNQFFLFPEKDILSSQSFIYNVKVCLDIRPTADKKMHRQIEFKRFQGLLTQLSILLCFYSTALWVCEDFRQHNFPHPHMCRCENVQKSYWFLHISACDCTQIPAPSLEWVQKCAHALTVCVSKWQIFCHSQWSI